MKKYLVVDQTLTSSGIAEEETYVFDTSSEANKTAAAFWDHLTAAERRKRHIFAAVVDESMLDPEAFDDSGAVDWSFWSCCDSFPGAFDSDNIT